MASLPKDYRNIDQTLLIGRDSIIIDQALAALRVNDRFMVRRKGEKKLGMTCIVRALIDGKPRIHNIKEGESLKEGVILVTKCNILAPRTVGD